MVDDLVRSFARRLPSTPARSSLAGTRTAIFGGSAGMGKATAEAVLALGGKVTLISRTKSKLDAAAAELGGGDNIEVVALNAMEVEAVEKYFSGLEQGYFHHVVVTLGPAVEGADDIFGAATLDKVQKQFSKFNVAWTVAKYGAPKVATGGSLTFFSGSLSRAIAKNSSCLAPVNAAVECLAKCLAKDLGPRLRVNCVSPTLTRTTAVTGGMSAERAEGMFVGFGKTLPAGRSGEAMDLGHAAAFLLTNNFMTGHVLDVDGGKTL